jgi:hypothetical protein
MKIITLFLLSFFAKNAYSQKAKFNVQKIKLPAEIEYYNNQFSGLYITNDNLLLLSESRLQDNDEAKLYSIKTTDVEKNMKDSNFVLPYKKILIKNLQILRDKMEVKGDEYEGLEAITLKDNTVYLSVETATPSNNCYLLKGILQDTTLTLDILFMLPLPKPMDATGKHIYNAGYEAITMIDETVYNILEYNSFAKNNNFAIAITPASYTNVAYQKVVVDELPFRITDITKTGKKTFTAINYFYKGEGDDGVYRVPTNDIKNDALTRDKNGYKSYCRLIAMEFKKNKFTWKPLWEFPTQYWAYNWEGIAAYKKGYFIMNDKYTPARPYSTVLLYVSPVK